MENKNNSNSKHTRRNVRQKVAIIGLSLALALSAGAAVTIPLVVKQNSGGGGETKTMYTVHYETDGGTELADSYVQKGTKLNEPTVSKTDYVLDGWYSNSAKTEKVTFPLTVNGNMTLYAKWTQSPGPSTYYTVHFESNGGTILSDQTVLSGKTINEPVVGKTGSTLEGWYTESTFITKWNFTSSKVTGATTLYAKWSEVPVVEYKTITFNGNDLVKFASESSTAQVQIQKGAQLGTIVYPSIVSITDGYAFDNWCWDTAGQQPVSATDPINEDKIIYAHCIEKNTKITISFSAGTGASLVGQSSIEVAKATTWADIKDNLPSATKSGYTFDCWLLNGQVIPDDTVFTANTMLTAAFTEDEVCTVEVVLAEGQELSEGVLEFNVDYGTKWKNISKPTLKEGTKVFSGWYKDEACSEQWDDDDEITDTWDSTKVYAKFETPTTCPTITFANPDTTSEYTWVGSQTYKAETSYVLWNNVSKPGVYKDITGGSWATGYESDSYFTQWSLSPTEYVEVPSRITVSTTVYPLFESKPELTIQYYDGAETKTETFKAEPTAMWSSIPLPAAQPTEINEYFVGWEATMKDSNTTKVLEPDDYVGDIDDSQPIIAKCSSEVNLITFETTGVENPGETTEKSISDIGYKGNATVGVDRTQTVYLKNVNKPIVNKTNYSFVRWQIWDDTLESPAWVEITDETVIASSESQTTTKIRPVVEETFTITFDANGGELIDPRPEGRGTVTTNGHTSFGNMYKPDVKPATDKVFKYWAIKNEDDTYTKIEDAYCFDAATTVYAIYEDDIISSIVNFKLTTADKADTDYPCTISGTQACINHKPGVEYKFKDISKATATKSLHYLEGWYYDEACQNPVGDDDVLPEGNEELTVYAKFAWTTTYEKVTVAEPTGPTPEYEILNENKMFVQTGSYWKNISNGFEIKLKKVGSEVDYFKDQNGNTVGDNYQFNTTTVLTPVWKDSVKQVTIDLEGDTTISGVTNGQLVEVPYYGVLKTRLTSISPSKDKNTFIGWKIKNADNTYTDVADDTVVTSDLTIVPKFRGESEFKNGTQPYFYDTTEGKWAAIVDCSGTEMTIRYAEATSTSTIDKYTFNEEVFFGSQMTEIPDYFMYGCTNWNNGYKASAGIAKPLTIPSTVHDANGVMKIGKFVFAGCSEFTQQLIIQAPTGFDYPELEVGESFMDQCYKWNNDLDLSGFEYITVGEAFMHDCKAWIGTLTLTCWMGVDGDATLCFATSDKYCNLAKLGFKVKTTSMSYDYFTDTFALSSVAPYRTHTKAE